MLLRHTFTLTVAVALSSFAPAVFAQTRVAVVDLQRAMNETSDGRRARRQLGRLYKRNQKSLNRASAKLKKMREDLEKQDAILTREGRERRLTELEKAVTDLRSRYVAYQRELAEEEARLTQGILGRMRGILRRIGEEGGYTLIIESSDSGVVWANATDLTETLIHRYENDPIEFEFTIGNAF